ncbi:hypothetical protein B0I35DRAFT_387979 [Stachybotrys elegans]|uniref:DUF2306 domain-containing protein n=1 Tax=Stachybotrys elegans TaxID=80388 RepID=A0A8K0SYK4_9HYPO|nr:hypothetical protein B0I35DRAFT_387979 [Stachybotrys elegans]
MAVSSKPPANRFVAVARKVYNPIGFTHGYNFIFFFIFGVAMTVFCLYSMPSMNVDGNFCGPNGGGAPGECFHYREGLDRIGMILHLVGILPAGILAVIQFVPAIRHKFLILHRINGYLVLLLSAIGAAGGFIISRHAFGGGLDTQFASGTLFVLFCTSLIISYINIKRLQLEQHRAWMLRAWFYGGAIITTRLIMNAAASIITNSGGYHVARSCAWLDFTIEDTERMLELYPLCSAWATGESPGQMVVVVAQMGGTSAAEAAAALSVPFGAASWLALALHAIGVEIYLHLTPGEAERLRKASYQRQLAAGMRHPGRAGLTSDRLGDAEIWTPKDAEQGSTGITTPPQEMTTAMKD